MLFDKKLKGTKEKKPEHKEGISWFVKIIVGVFIILLAGDIILTILETSGDPEKIGEALGGEIGYIIGFMFALYCGKKCFEMASKIKKPKSFAYLIGFMFAFLGLLIYWIYSKMIRAKFSKWIIISYEIIMGIFLITFAILVLIVSISVGFL